MSVFQNIPHVNSLNSAVSRIGRVNIFEKNETLPISDITDPVYFQLAFKKYMKNTIESYDYLIAQLNKNIRGLKAHPRILVDDEHKYLYPIYEKAMYIAISSSDLIIALKHLDISHSINNGYETSYFSRNVAHISYELINHQQKIVGENVSKIIIEKIGTVNLLKLKGYKKQLKVITKNHHKELNFIRNNLFGHRTENGSEMAMSMLKVDAHEVYKIGKNVFDVYINLLAEYVYLLSKL